MASRVTRRQLAAALAAPALIAQTPQPASLPRNAQEELDAARAQIRQSLDLLNRFQLPPETEPAVHFKA